jgi:mannose-6-phosphate isomerase-like protein (cupin superfamily)
MEELVQKRSSRILDQLRTKYPGKKSFDLDGRGLHFVCEVEPTSEHPEYDIAVEVIISSKPHKHLKTKQRYRVISGSLELHVNSDIVLLQPGGVYVIQPEAVHWATSNEAWVEVHSEPGWTEADHIPVGAC